jgi:hypothetical protein
VKARGVDLVVWGTASGTTMIAVVVGLALAALLDTVGALGLGGPKVAATVVLYGDSAMGLLVAAVIAYVAWQLDPGEWRTTWALLAVAVFVGAVADGLWAAGEISIVGPDLGFNLSDGFYLLGYLIIDAAVLRWVLSRRSQIDVAWIATESLVGTAVLGLTVWVAYLAPTIRSLATPGSTVGVDGMWVALDFPFLIAPTLMLALALMRLDDDDAWAVLRPFMFAIAILVVADMGWFWERSHTGWAPGSLTDFAFMVSNVLIAIGALTMLDIQTDRAAEKRRYSQLSA